MSQTITTLPPESTAHSPLGEEYSALDLLIVIARRKRFLIRFTAGVVILVGIIVFLLPNQYIANSTVIPPAQNSLTSSGLLASLAGGGALASLAGGSLGIKSPGEMYISLITSRTVEDSVIRRFGLVERYKEKTMLETRKRLEQHVTVELGTKNNIITISAKDKDPRVAADIANGYVDEYNKLADRLALTEAAQRRIFYTERLKEAKDNLSNAEMAMKLMEQKTGVLQIDSQAKTLIQSAVMLNAQIVALRVQIQGMRTYATDDNPDIITARGQLDTLQAQLAKLGGSGTDDNPLMIPKGRVPENAVEYVRRYRDVKYYETLYQLIAQQFEMARLDEAREGTNIQVVDVAIPPDKKSSPHRTLIIAISFFVALVLGSAFILASEGMKTLTRDVKHAEAIHTLKRLLVSRR